MRYINTLHEGETIRNVYLCKGKRSAETRNGRPYDNLILQDKTGTLDGKVWDPNSGGIADYDEMDFIEVYGEIISYNNNLQLNIKQIRKAQEGEYIAADYMPTTEKSTDGMYEELLGYIKKVENQYLRQVLEYYFVKDETFIRNFKGHSAAKTVHHGFAGGLLEHIVIGVEMIGDAVRNIPDFPEKLANELKHCIVAHHGELEYGSPKKPALAEAMALNLADNADAKMQTLTELFKDKKGNDWLGYNRLFESNIRKTVI